MGIVVMFMALASLTPFLFVQLNKKDNRCCTNSDADWNVDLFFPSIIPYRSPCILHHLDYVLRQPAHS
ncbi:hypothetical protein RWE15_08295 [Virgibacillus halophilus]|uniref:Uncharacterized protein n=1 Tax=Tigheibacillus halophilus TaxID=361280 RepID=A0ABU5C546_9BACI|nr:hypothetical protein [Virgibacillus halophilus]